MKNYCLGLLLFLALLSKTCLAQQQEAGVFVYNTLFGGFTAGVGAIINKEKGTQWTKAFAKGAWQGCIGGSINYLGKRSLYLVNRNENIAWALPARLLHSAGLSIIENAARNEPFLQNWNCIYGPVRLDFSLGQTPHFRARLLPNTILCMFDAAKDKQLDLGTSLWSGSIAFVENRSSFVYNRGQTFLGLSYGRVFNYAALSHSSKEIHATMAHEIVHTYQYDDYQLFNTWLKPLEKKVTNKTLKTIFSRYVYLDIPYFYVPYGLEGNHPYPYYYKNFFEFEAERFATFKLVPLH